MIDKTELLNVGISPFEDSTENLYYGYNRIRCFTIQYLYKVMLWRYYEKLSKKYDWGIEIESCSVILESNTISEDAYIDDFYTLVNANFKLLLSIVKRFGWEMTVVEVDPDDPSFKEYSNKEGDLKAFLNTYKEMPENEKELLLSYQEIFQDIGVMDETSDVWVLYLPKLGRYLKFRNENMERVKELFQEEDKRIMELVDYLGHPLFYQFEKNYKQEEDRFLVAFICGYGMGGEIDLHYLTPQWVIGSFVTYELLLHAEQIFGYHGIEMEE